VPNFDETSARLFASLPRLDYPKRAATGLLLWHEYWLRRADFRKQCVRTAADMTVIAWSKIADFIAANPRCSSSELAVLQLADFIAVDPFKLSSFGHAHRQHAVEAFAASLGVTALVASNEGRRG
jgi:hypothetical protein